MPLFMPVIALPILWLLPLSLAVPLYAVIVLISGLLYWLVVKSMRKRPLTGVESLIGSEAEGCIRAARRPWRSVSGPISGRTVDRPQR